MSMSTVPSSQSNETCHVAVLAFPFGSHPMTLLSLTQKLALEARRVRFSFFNTAKSNSSLFDQPKYKSLPQNLRAYDVDNGVPSGKILSSPIEAADLFMKAAPESFKTALDSISSGAKITCLLADVFLTFAGDLSKKYLDGVPWIALWCSHPCSLSAHLYTDLIRSRCAGSGNEDISLDFIPGLSDMKVEDLPGQVISEDNSLLSRALSQIATLLPRDCTALLLHSHQTLCPNILTQDLKSKFTKVLSLGFLTLSSFSGGDCQQDKDDELLLWLNGQKEMSVVYVAFGTVVSLPRNEMVVLAEALEDSNVHFVWSLKDHLKLDLPAGFEERTSRFGKIVSWAPQQRVLNHSSVGVFVTQAGINSVYESIAAQVPIICRPFFADQFMIARMVKDVWKIGVKTESKMFTKSELLNWFDLVFRQAEEVKLMRERLGKLKQAILEDSGSIGIAAKDFQTLVEVVSSTHT